VFSEKIEKKMRTLISFEIEPTHHPTKLKNQPAPLVRMGCLTVVIVGDGTVVAVVTVLPVLTVMTVMTVMTVVVTMVTVATDS
jgi:hypothetical protein